MKPLTDTEHQLLALTRALDADRRATLAAYARRLTARRAQVEHDQHRTTTEAEPCA